MLASNAKTTIVLYQCFGTYLATNEDNYKRRIRNDREIYRLEGCNRQDAIEIAFKWLKADTVKVYDVLELTGVYEK